MDIENEKIREAAYWRERYNILNAANARLTRQTYEDVEHAFELAQRDIQRDIDVWLNRFANNNGVTLVEARRLLNSDELKELKWDVAEYIKRGRENAISGKWAKELENASARLHISRLEALKIRTQNHLETAFAAENKAVENLVKNVYKSDYYHTCFELQKGFGVGFDISGIDERQLDMLIKKPWTVDRRTFSDRIWERKDKMVSALHQEMIRNCIYGRSRKEMTAALEQFVKKDIKNAEYCTARVIKTETAYFTSQSQRQALSDLDCEMYEVYLPLSPKSCEICREMNRKHFKLSEYVVGSTAPPFHPNCENGSIIPYYEDGFFDNIKSGEKIPEDITYPEWEKKFVKGNRLTNDENSGIIEETVFHEFKNGDEVNNFFYFDDGAPGVLSAENSSYGIWINGLSADQKNAVYEYTCGGYSDLNNFLRHTSGWEHMDEQVMNAFKNDLQSAVSGFNLKEPIKVYRYTGSDTFNIKNLNDLVGTEFVDNGFMSASPTLEGVENAVITGKDILLEISVPVGKGYGAYINELSAWKDEEFEFLFSCGARFDIVSVDTTGNVPIVRMVAK